MTKADSPGMTLLMKAALGENLALVRDHDIMTGIVDSRGWTALIHKLNDNFCHSNYTRIGDLYATD